MPQLVVCEDILSRAPRGSSEFVVPENFSLAHPVRASRSADGAVRKGRWPCPQQHKEMIVEAREMCRADWGPYPELAEICREGGTWVFRLGIHEHDANPSTYVRGGVSRGSKLRVVDTRWTRGASSCPRV